ncbi:hypothetical protein QR680_017407 [Steinernema hermaphroditum]|uniref:Uncharacterized protein n=1 Tax=Steinernema hermaphroditum TaxID=289476 RepID=A0AA39LNY5_9BILA|nr:hypothetical protein QR680_017407 [Steinernema hermaphroditum]
MIDVDTYKYLLEEQISLLSAEANKQLTSARHSMKDGYDRAHRARNRDFAIGDFVYAKRPEKQIRCTKCAKIDPVNKGPFKIIELVLLKPNGKKETIRFDRLTKATFPCSAPPSARVLTVLLSSVSVTMCATGDCDKCLFPGLDYDEEERTEEMTVEEREEEAPKNPQPPAQEDDAPSAMPVNEVAPRQPAGTVKERKHKRQVRTGRVAKKAPTTTPKENDTSIFTSGRLASKKGPLPPPATIRKALLPTPNIPPHKPHGVNLRSSKNSPTCDPLRRSDITSRIAASATTTAQTLTVPASPVTTGKTIVFGDAFALDIGRHVSDGTYTITDLDDIRSFTVQRNATHVVVAISHAFAISQGLPATVRAIGDLVEQETRTDTRFYILAPPPLPAQFTSYWPLVSMIEALCDRLQQAEWICSGKHQSLLSIYLLGMNEASRTNITTEELLNSRVRSTVVALLTEAAQLPLHHRKAPSGASHTL